MVWERQNKMRSQKVRKFILKSEIQIHVTKFMNCKEFF